jgi:hypothetical protein
MEKLRQLRVFFIVYFAVKAAIDLGFGRNLIPAELMGSVLTPTGLLMSIAVTDAILFVVGLLLFKFLLDLKHWARVVLLIVAWVNVLDALLGFIFASQIPAFIRHIDDGMDWSRLVWIDRATDMLGLLYWGYFIYALQIRPEGRRMFAPGEHDSGRPSGV